MATVQAVTTAPARPAAGPPAPKLSGHPRAKIAAKTLRKDNYKREPLITFAVLTAFVIYSTFRAFYGKHYFAEPYISPFFSPPLSSAVEHAAKYGNIGVPPHLSWLPTTEYVFTPAIWILVVPLGFRFTCYYYRKAYYRSFWASPPACAVAEPHGKYTGETRFPLIIQNVHRYFWYLGLVLNCILTYDAVEGFIWHKNGSTHFGLGLGSFVLIANAVLLWSYSLSCHSCRHIVGGRLNHFSKHPVRYRLWTWVGKLNEKHMPIAWISLFGVALTDLYVYLVSSGVFSDPHWIS